MNSWRGASYVTTIDTSLETAGGRQIKSWKKKEEVILSVKSKKYARNVPFESTEFLTGLQTKCQGTRQKRGQSALVSAVKEHWGKGTPTFSRSQGRSEWTQGGTVSILSLASVKEPAPQQPWAYSGEEVVLVLFKLQGGDSTIGLKRKTQTVCQSWKQCLWLQAGGWGMRGNCQAQNI